MSDYSGAAATGEADEGSGGEEGGGWFRDRLEGDFAEADAVTAWGWAEAAAGEIVVGDGEFNEAGELDAAGEGVAVASGAGECGGEGFDWAAGEGASGGEAEGEGADAVGVAVVVALCADFREWQGGA